MSMDQLMALVPIESATSLSTTTSKGRRSRWERSTVACRSSTRFGPKEEKAYNPPPFVDLPPGLTPLQLDQFLREQRLEELSSKLEKRELEYGDPDIRPPSPPPAYDRNGTRMNMRETRVKNAMLSEHQRLIEFMTKNVPGFIPPTDFKPLKKIRRIIIPQEKYPEYNFMGLIIGPRGCNHKRLESESGAQISIRGRGTQKEGKKTDHQTEEEAAMPQHIHIAADTEESLDKAVALIEPLLNPFHPAHEEFKKKGLEQLALVNGVALTKLDSRCTVCGALGHLNWECPDADFQSFQKACVKCGLCGDKGHVTMDCKLAKGLTSEELAEIEKKTQGIQQGGPQHFGGGGGAMKSGSIPPPPPPPPPSQTGTDSLQLDLEFSQMMSEISRGRETTQEISLDTASLVPDLNANGLVNGKKVTNQYPGFLANQTVQDLQGQMYTPESLQANTTNYANATYAMQYSLSGYDQYSFTQAAAGSNNKNASGVHDVNKTINYSNPTGSSNYMIPWGYQNPSLVSEVPADSTAYNEGNQNNCNYYNTCGTGNYQMDTWTQQMSQMFGYYPNMYSYTVPDQQQNQQGQQTQQTQEIQHTTILPRIPVTETTPTPASFGSRLTNPSPLFNMASSLAPPTVEAPETVLPCPPPAEEYPDAGEDAIPDEPNAPPPP